MTLPLALTMGEPAGIGGEIALKAWMRRGEGIPPFYLVDHPERLAKLAKARSEVGRQAAGDRQAGTGGGGLR